MPLDPSYAGRTYPASAPYDVGREKIREFARAVGDTNPLYTDREAAVAAGYSDVIAPPTFPIVLSMDIAAQVIEDPDLGLDFSRVVHGDQKFTYSRPITAGDQLVGVLRIESIKAAGGNDFLVTSAELSTPEGEHVVTSRTMFVVRGEGA